MRFVSKKVLAVLLGALAIVVVLPVSAMAWSEVVSVPTTATSGQPFTVRIACDREHGTDVEVVASRTSGEATSTEIVAVQDGKLYDGFASFVATVTLPTGGDWSVAAREAVDPDSGDGPWDSSALTVSCDPASFHLSSSITHSWVSFASSPVLTGTVKHLDGTPATSTVCELISFDGDVPAVVKTASTDSSGKVSATLSHTTAYEPIAARSWAWRVKGVDEVGGVLGLQRGTKLKTILHKDVFTRKTYTGKVKLTKGTKYQFWALNGDANHRTAFVLRWKSSTGHTYVTVSAKRFAKKSFTIPKTGTYYWRTQFTKGTYASWAIW